MRLLRGIVLSVVGVALLAGVGLIFHKGRQAKQNASAEFARRHDRPIPVRTHFVTQSTVDDVVGATAVTEPSRVVTIRVGAGRLSPSREFKATAMLVKEVHVAEGTLVQDGDLLFELDKAPLQQVVQQREAEFAAAQAELDLTKQTTALNQKLRDLELISARANLDYRIEDLETRKRLVETADQLFARNASTLLQLLETKAKYSQASFDRAEADRALQRAENAVATGTLRDTLELELATAKYEAARVALEMTQNDVLACEIKTPLSGFVGSMSLVPGEVIETAAELTRILQLDPILVRVDFPQERIDEVVVGQTADVVLDSFPKETFQGSVVRIAPQANPQLRIVPVYVSVANSKYRIKAGISGFARLRVSKTATLVPGTALIEQGRRTIVFHVEDGRAQIREVHSGPTIREGWVEIRSGLVPGEEVIIYGTEDLIDGDPVDVNWRKWALRE